MTVDQKKEKNICFIVRDDLCTGCATCAGLCPEECISMHLDGKTGLLHPLIEDSLCTQCGVCDRSCPGFKVDVCTLKPVSWDNLLSDHYLGTYSSLYIGCSNDDHIRFNGASGGMVSAFLIYLLDTGRIDGAAVTRMSQKKPLQAEPFIARTREEILLAQKSKYCPVPLNKILRDIRDLPGRYALVGLPCHIDGIRKAQKNDSALHEKLPYLIGLFCSRMPSFNATLFLLRRLGIAEEDVVSITYRGQGYPGKMRIVLRDGSERFVPHLDFNYWGYVFYKFFIPVRCWLCSDKSAELADISFADNWTGLPPYRDDSKGSSTIVARSPDCAVLLENMVKEGRISLFPITKDIVMTSQDLPRKSNVFPRMWLLQRLRHAIPNFEKGEVNKTKVSINEILTTFPSLIRVLITQRKRSYWILNSIIRLFWIQERLLSKLQKGMTVIGYGIKASLPEKGGFQSKSQRYKVVMIGGFGAQDIGDEAMPHADRLNLRNVLGDVEIVMFSPNPEYTCHFHSERSIRDLKELGFSPNANIIIKFVKLMASSVFLLGAFLERLGIHIRLWHSARLALDEIASADLVFNVGGANLNSIITQELYKKCAIYLAARILGKPVIVSGQTIGPFYKWLDRRVAAFALNQVRMITLRDKDVSRRRLHEIGVIKPEIFDTADDAMTLPFLSAEESFKVLRNDAGDNWIEMKSDLTVGLNLKGALKIFKGPGRTSDVSQEINLLAKIADKTIERYNAKIVFIPTDYGHGVDDRELHRIILSSMKYKKRGVCLEGRYDDITLKGIIGLMDLAIGSRYHFCVFAASMGVPTIGIASGVYQMTKLKGLMDLYDLPECFIDSDMEFAKLEEIWPKIEVIIEKRESISEQIREKTPILQERSLQTIYKATEIIYKNIMKDED